jgi:hypothetical protein
MILKASDEISKNSRSLIQTKTNVPSMKNVHDGSVPDVAIQFEAVVDRTNSELGDNDFNRHSTLHFKSHHIDS